MEKVFTGRVDCLCIRATTVDESMPPERNAPRGTSDTMRLPTASARRRSSPFRCFLHGSLESVLESRLHRFVQTPICFGTRIRQRSNIDTQDPSRPQLANFPENRERRRDVVEPHERADRILIDRAAEIRVRPECGDFRREQEPVRRGAVVERLDPQAVPNQVKAAVRAIPYREGEHADDAPHSGLDAPDSAGLEYDFPCRSARGTPSLDAPAPCEAPPRCRSLRCTRSRTARKRRPSAALRSRRGR